MTTTAKKKIVKRGRKELYGEPTASISFRCPASAEKDFRKVIEDKLEPLKNKKA